MGLWRRWEVTFGSNTTLTYELNVQSGSIAEHICMYTLLKPIPKLRNERQHDFWQRVNRGGFCGPLMGFDPTAPPGWSMYKIDITSLYPAAANKFGFMTTLGKKAPLAKYYRDLPDPTVNPSTGEGGWFRYDYQCKKMGPEDFNQFETCTASSRSGSISPS